MSAAKINPMSALPGVATLVEMVRQMPGADPRFALFLGAGASISSGIPAASTLIDGWRRAIFCDLFRLERMRPEHEAAYGRWKSPEYGDNVTVDEKTGPNYPAWRTLREQEDRQPGEYALLFSRIFPDRESRQGFIEKLCDGAEPCAGYVYLASLVRDGYFRTILTTNFDDLVHDAIFRYSGKKPVVCAFDSQVATVRMVSPRPKVIKLHGDFLYSSIRNVGGEVARLDINMRDKFEQTCANYGLIVLGYSGGDRSVMDPIRSMLTRPGYLGHGLHWGVYWDGEEQDPEKVIPEEVRVLQRHYPEHVHVYALRSFDETMGALARGLGVAPPDELLHPERLSAYLRLRSAIDNAEQGWRLEAGFRELLSRFRDAQDNPADAVAKALDLADAKHLEGNRKKNEAKAISDESARRACLEQAIRDFRDADERCAKKSEHSSDPLSTVNRLWIARRRMGALTGICEALYYLEKGALPAQSAALSEYLNEGTWCGATRSPGSFNETALHALEIGREAWSWSATLSSQPTIAGHLRNIAFNGLLAVAYLLRAAHITAETTEARDRALALAWFDHLQRDRTFGSEFLGELRNDIGGQLLMVAIDTWAREPLPEGGPSPEDATPSPPVTDPAPTATSTVSSGQKKAKASKN
jgi:NAD-dependent SIR2 family protein deacetylase